MLEILSKALYSSIHNMHASYSLVIVTIIIALVFDFLNGFHDAANSIATVVSTRVLKPHWAVLWAASFNFIAFLFFLLLMFFVMIIFFNFTYLRIDFCFCQM